MNIERLRRENAVLRQQLLTHSRTRKRTPPLTTFDKIVFGLTSFGLSKAEIERNAIIIKPATILKFHRFLVQKKYSMLFSNKKAKPGRKGPSQEIIDLVVALKVKNPRFGYGRISMQIYHAYGRFPVAARQKAALFEGRATSHGWLGRHQPPWTAL